MARPRKIVIDANIARSSGTTEHPVSKSCREALDNILSYDHSFVACKTLLLEWKKHQSNYSAKWLASMFARRRVEIVSHSDPSKPVISDSEANGNFKSAALKDSHIIDAASSKGKFVTSNDDRAREAFASIPELRGATKSITWINPVTEAAVLSEILSNKKNIKPSHRIGLK